MSETTGKAFDYKLFKRVLKYVKPYKSLFILTGILTIVLSFMAPLRTLLVQKALDNHVLTGDAQGLTQITLLILAILIMNAF
jgi:ATP-binding cassette subfamily B multidrug efflux pump